MKGEGRRVRGKGGRCTRGAAQRSSSLDCNSSPRVRCSKVQGRATAMLRPLIMDTVMQKVGALAAERGGEEEEEADEC